MGTPYIVIAHHSDGLRVTDHASKAEAHRLGMSLRRAGVTAYAHSVAFAAQFNLDPRGA